MIRDHLEVTAVKGAGMGEKLHRSLAQPGDLVLAHRGLCKPTAIGQLAAQGAHVIVRVNTGSLLLRNLEGTRFELCARLRWLVQPGKVKQCDVIVGSAAAGLRGRPCVLRKSETQARRAVQRIFRKALQAGPEPKAETLMCANFGIVLTTPEETELNARQVLEWYRLRWQIEPVFK